MTSVLKNPDDFKEIKWCTSGEDFDLEFGDGKGLTLKILENEQIDSRRWVSIHRIVWEENGTFYACFYEQGLTEYQEGSESEFDPRDIFEVEPTEITITKYVKKV